MPIERLTREVEQLLREAAAVREAQRRRNWLLGVLVVLVVLLLAAVAGLGAVTLRQQSSIEAQLIEDCAFFGGIGSASVAPNATELSRRLVRDARRSYQVRGCVPELGPLAPADPDQNSPAPSPAPSPTR